MGDCNPQFAAVEFEAVCLTIQAVYANIGMYV